MKPRGYTLTIISASLGLISGGILGYWYTTSTGILEGNPNVGMANLGLILAAIAIIMTFAATSGVIATYVGLRITKHDKAIRTSLYLAGLYAIGLVISIFILPLIISLLVLPLLARHLATK